VQGSTSYVASQWYIYPVNTTSTLGNHTSDVPSATPSFVAGYENLLVTSNSVDVNGLVLGETYYYRVRAIIDDCTSANSTV
jgi:hypothetical protein